MFVLFSAAKLLHETDPASGLSTNATGLSTKNRPLRRKAFSLRRKRGRNPGRKRCRTRPSRAKWGTGPPGSKEKRLPGTLEGGSVPGERFFGVPGTLGPFPVPSRWRLLKETDKTGRKTRKKREFFLPLFGGKPQGFQYFAAAHRSKRLIRKVNGSFLSSLPL